MSTKSSEATQPKCKLLSGSERSATQNEKCNYKRKKQDKHIF